MDAEDRQWGETVLRHLLVGAEISGSCVDAFREKLIVDRPQGGAPSCPPRQVFVGLESAWTVFEARPETLPAAEADLPSRSAEAQAQLLSTLCGKTIRAVELGTVAPHLLLTLDDEQVFFVWGDDDLYESWQCGSVDHGQDSFWLVVVTPSGGLAIWAPADFS